MTTLVLLDQAAVASIPIAGLIVFGALTIGVLIWPWVASGPSLDDLLEVDHDRCPVDDCNRVLCFCQTDSACVDTEDPCSHNEPVCDRHRYEGCLGCRLDAMDDAGLLG